MEKSLVETPVARTYGGRDATERAAERRERFIEVGVRLFGTVGYHRTSVRMLTAAAGLNNRYFYECFGSMEEVLIACYRHLMHNFRVRLEPVLQGSGGGFEEDIRNAITCYFREIQDPLFARITQVEVVGISPEVDTVYVRTMREFAVLGMRPLANFKLVPGVSPRELEIIGYALIGSMMNAGALWVRSHYRDALETVVNSTLRIILSTFHGLIEPAQRENAASAASDRKQSRRK